MFHNNVFLVQTVKIHRLLCLTVSHTRCCESPVTTLQPAVRCATVKLSFCLEVFHPEVFVKQKVGEVPSNTTMVKLNI